jgi:hypothetical protein
VLYYGPHPTYTLYTVGKARVSLLLTSDISMLFHEQK